MTPSQSGEKLIPSTSFAASQEPVLLVSRFYLQALGHLIDRVWKQTPNPSINTSTEPTSNESTTPTTIQSQEKKPRKVSKRTKPPRLSHQKVPKTLKSTAPPNFTLFQKLPAEMREKIWGFVASMQPRLVIIPQSFQMYPVTAHVCSESRAFVYRGYHAFKDPDNERGPAIWINLRFDTIYLNIPSLRDHVGTFASTSSSSYRDTELYQELLPYSKLLSSAKYVSIPITCAKFTKLSAVGKLLAQERKAKAAQRTKPRRLVVDSNVSFWNMMAHFCPEARVVHVVAGIWVNIRFDKEPRLQSDDSYLHSRLVKRRSIWRRGDVVLDLSAFWGKQKAGVKRSVTAFWVNGFFAALKENYWFVDAPSIYM